MSGPISIASTSQWQSLLSSTNVVVADFYADWCGPCKVIAPHYEKLAKEHSRPKKVAFAKINVDTQSTISQSLDVRAMPTFKIFHSGVCIDTIKGANPSALTEAVAKALKLGDAGKRGDTFKTAGRTLGGPSAAGGRSLARPMSWDINNMINSLVTFLGLYLVSLISLDAYKSAEKSTFNIHKAPAPAKVPGAGPSGSRAAAKPAFRTLADLGSNE